ncbi:MAG: GDYXXLXY domain-containing protein [Oceanicaulis sp.]
MSLFVRLAAVALAMSAILAAMVGVHAANRAGGTEIYLDMAPVDPRDLLLGHYVILETELHRLDTADLDGPKTGWARGDTVYVALEETQTGSMAPAGAFNEPPTGVFIQGRVESVSTTRDFDDPVLRRDGSLGFRREAIPGTERDALRVRYNLERYYAPRDQALALERMRNENRLRLIVSLADDGSAVIKGLEIDGEAQYDTLF